MASNTSGAMEQARELLEVRLREIDQERRQVERALAEMTGGVRRGPGRPRGSRRRRRRGANRADQALEAVRAKPGITGSEIAAKLGIKPNYVYRLMGELTKEGKVRKSGRSYQPA
jgi:hypothetical protein